MKAGIVAALLAAFSFGVQAASYNHAVTVIECDGAEDVGRLTFKFKDRMTLEDMLEQTERTAKNNEFKLIALRAIRDSYDQPTEALAAGVARMRCMERRLP